MVENTGDAALATQTPAIAEGGRQLNLVDLLNSRPGATPPDSRPGGIDSTQFHLTGLELPHTLPGHQAEAGKAPAIIPPIRGDSSLPTPVHRVDAPALGGTNLDHESKALKVGREALVIGGGLGRSVLYGMASLPQRTTEIGETMAIGATLSTLSKAGELGAASTLIVGAYFTSKFIVNAINDTPRWEKLGAAVSDTWNSDQHMMKDLKDVSDSGGNFVFDTGLSYASGYVGFKNKALGELLLKVFNQPIPGIPAKMPLPPLLAGATPYLAVVPAPFLYRHSNHDGGKSDEEDEKNHAHDK